MVSISKNEIYIMDILWSNRGEASAKDIAQLLQRQLYWSKTTVYTMLNRLIRKGAVERIDPGFICRSLCDRDALRYAETDALIDRFYNGSLSDFVEEYLLRQEISPQEKVLIKRMIEKL